MKRLLLIWIVIAAASTASAGGAFEKVKSFAGACFVFDLLEDVNNVSHPQDATKKCAHNDKAEDKAAKQEISCTTAKISSSHLDAECTLPGLMRRARGLPENYCVCNQCDCK